MASGSSAGRAEPLPELAGVHWRTLASDATLTRAGRRWTLVTAAHTVPPSAVAALLVALNPVTIPVALVLLAHAWVIPELYAARGANVVRTKASAPPGPERGALPPGPERGALGFLCELVAAPERELLLATGLVLEDGRLGTWLVGDTGALLIRPGGRRVHCYCVKVSEPGLPSGDRIAHLLLALRADEAGFATVANLAFSGACWRLHRRLAGRARAAFEVACERTRGQRPQDTGR